MVDVIATSRPQVVFHSFGTFTDLGGKYQSGHDDLLMPASKRQGERTAYDVVPANLADGAAMFVILTTVGLLGDVFVGILLQSRLKFLSLSQKWNSWRQTRRVRARYLALVQGRKRPSRSMQPLSR
jgi:hypothetical protein